MLTLFELSVKVVVRHQIAFDEVPHTCIATLNDERKNQDVLIKKYLNHWVIDVHELVVELEHMNIFAHFDEHCTKLPFRQYFWVSTEDVPYQLILKRADLIRIYSGEEEDKNIFRVLVRYASCDIRGGLLYRSTVQLINWFFRLNIVLKRYNCNLNWTTYLQLYQHKLDDWIEDRLSISFVFLKQFINFLLLLKYHVFSIVRARRFNRNSANIKTFTLYDR